MKRLIVFALLLLLAVGAFAAAGDGPVYSEERTRFTKDFIFHTELITQAKADTLNKQPYMVSQVIPVDKMSNKDIMIHGKIKTKLQKYSGGDTDVTSYNCVLQASFDGKTFFDVYPASNYKVSAAADTEFYITISTKGVLAPYYRVRWIGYYFNGNPLTGIALYGAIYTTVVVPR